MHPHHHELAKLWAHTTPSALGIGLVALLAIAGIGLVLWLLRSHEGPDKPVADHLPTGPGRP